MATIKLECQIKSGALNILDTECLTSFESLQNKIDKLYNINTTLLNKNDFNCSILQNKLVVNDNLCTMLFELKFNANFECKAISLSSAVLDKLCNVNTTLTGINDISCVVKAIQAIVQDIICSTKTVKLINQDTICSINAIKLNYLDIICIANTLLLSYIDFICNTKSRPSYLYDILKTCLFKLYSSKGIYMTENNVRLKRKSDNTYIPIISGSVKTDINSWLWDFEATLPTKYMLDLCFDSNPVEVELTVNEHVWEFIIENKDFSYRFGDWSFSVTGRSKTCILGEPYSNNYTKTFTDATTAQSLVAQEISPVILDWQVLDWVIPANMFSVSNTSKIDVVKQVAKAIMATVQSDMKDVKVVVTSTTKANWAAEVVKVILSSTILSQTIKTTDKPFYNYVITSGTKKITNYEYLVHCKRGNADIPAPPISDGLLFTRNACVERGREFVEQSCFDTHTLDVLPDFLYLPTNVVYIDDNKTQWRGIVKSTRISFSFSSIIQTIEVDRKTNA